MSDEQLTEVFRRAMAATGGSVHLAVRAVRLALEGDRPIARLPREVPGWPPGLTAEAFLEVVARVCGITLRELVELDKYRSQARARWVAMFIMRRVWRLKVTRAAAVLGLNHASVVYGLRQVERDPRLRAQAAQVLAQLGPREQAA